ncbi:MAG: hypothetical protein ACREQA_08410, partial [Candidatus Binatia bacterium]
MRDPAGTILESLSLSVFDCNVKAECQDPEVLRLLVANYGQLQGGLGAADLHYVVGRRKGSPAFIITRNGQEHMTASDDGEFLFLFEKDLTIELQKLRRDLYFVHAAALEFAGRALM